MLQPIKHDQGRMEHMWPFFDMWEFWPWMIFGPLSMIVFWGIVIWALVTLISRSNTDQSGGNAGAASQEPSAAIRILEERFARGEITREEFEEMRRVLSS